MIEPFHIGLVMLGGPGWMGGTEYIKNLAHAVARIARDEDPSVHLTIFTGHALETSLHRELAELGSIIELPPRRRDFLSRLVRAGNHAFVRAVMKSPVNFLYPLTYDNEHNVGATFPLGPALARVRWAGWIPDFQHLQLPQLFTPAELAKRDRGIGSLAHEAAAIVFSSEASARDFRRTCPASPARVEVLHFCTSPVAEWFANDPVAVQQKYHLPDRFFLISNQLWQHKNHLLVIDALAELAGRGIPPHVVCTGQPADFRDKNFINVVLQRLHARGVAAQVSLLGLIPRAEQVQLMRRSVAVIQPSLCEGWSTVVEDARVLGKVVVLSDLEVHREQNPPRAVFFARDSAAALADELATIWATAEAGPDLRREVAARTEAEQAQLAFGRRFLEIARHPA